MLREFILSNLLGSKVNMIEIGEEEINEIETQDSDKTSTYSISLFTFCKSVP